MSHFILAINQRCSEHNKPFPLFDDCDVISDPCSEDEFSEESGYCYQCTCMSAKNIFYFYYDILGKHLFFIEH